MTTTQIHRRPFGHDRGIDRGHSFGRVRTGLRALAAGLLLASVAGCPSPDAEGKYNAFNEETEDERNRPEPKLDLPPSDDDTGTDGGPSFPDINGTFLVAVDTSVNPGLPLQFLAEVTADLDPATGDGTMMVNFQPLSLEVGSTTDPREEVGDAIDIESDVTGGSFVLAFGETMVTGMANPITGSDILADIALEGNIRHENGWCGAATGDVLSPIQVPLTGSTFGAMRLADRNERPLEFPVDCAGVDAMAPAEGDTDGGTTGDIGTTGG